MKRYKFDIHDEVTYIWSGKEIKCKVVQREYRSGKSLSTKDLTLSVNSDHDNIPIYKLKIIDDNSSSKGQLVLKYENQNDLKKA